MTTPPPAAPSRDLDLARAFRFFFEDPDWIKKILIGGVFMLLSSVIVGGIFVGGYAVHVLRRVIRGEPRPLPEWDDLGTYFGDGLRAFGLYLIHLVVVGIVPAAIGFTIFVLGGGIAALGSSRGGTGAVEGLMALLIVGLYGVTIVLMLLLMIYLPAAFIRFVIFDRLAAGFEVAENVAFIRRNLGQYALALVIYLLASFVAQLGFIACCVGYFPAAFWAVCVGAWALGEVARRDRVLAPALLR